MKKYSLLLLLFFSCAFLKAQTTLTLEAAVATTLKNNYAILIAKNNQQVAANNNTLGNAGFLPTLAFNATATSANNNTKQNFSSGLTVDKNNVGSSAVTSGVYLNWTVFDGFQMFVAKKQLSEIEALNQLSTKVQIENSIQQIIVAYFNLVKQKQLIKGLHLAKNVSDERITLAQKKIDLGNGSNVELLQAKIDANAQLSEIYLQQSILKTGKANLNTLMNVAVEADYEVVDTIPITNFVGYDELKNTVLKNNTSLLVAEKNTSISKLSLKEMQTNYLPKLAVNSSYLFSKNKNAAGFTLLNQNLGYNAGLNLSWTLFNGFNTDRQVKNAKLSVLTSQYEWEATAKQLNYAAFEAYDQFKNALKILTLEESTADLAKENMSISLARFKAGLSTALELKEAEHSFEDTHTRLVNARYNAKIAETNLLKLQGGFLVK